MSMLSQQLVAAVLSRQSDNCSTVTPEDTDASAAPRQTAPASGRSVHERLTLPCRYQIIKTKH